MVSVNLKYAGGGSTMEPLQTISKIPLAISDSNPLYGSGIKNLPDTIIPTNISLLAKP